MIGNISPVKDIADSGFEPENKYAFTENIMRWKVTENDRIRVFL